MYCANTQKAELLEICRTQGIRKVSRLTKNELAAKITAHLTVGVAEKMVCWDQPTYDLMDHIVSEKDPYYPLDPDSPADVEAYFLLFAPLGRELGGFSEWIFEVDPFIIAGELEQPQNIRWDIVR
ncbi:MAG: Rho termination factor N-terminal domain-containing protein, partial [Eubacteriales bacterium]